MTIKKHLYSLNTIFSFWYIVSNNQQDDTDVQDKIVEKIHKEEGLDEEDNNYNVNDSLSDSNEQDAQKDNTGHNLTGNK